MTRQQRERDALIQQIATVRRGFAMRLARDNRDVFDRLDGAYKRATYELEDRISDLIDGLGPNYPDNVDERFQGTLERFRRGIAEDLGYMQDAIRAASQTLGNDAVAAGYRSGIAALRGGGMGVSFSEPVLETLQETINFVDSPVFRLKVNDYANYHASQVADMILAGVAQGENPLTVAKTIEKYFAPGAAPAEDARRLARTTQLYSARRGAIATYREHGVEQWLWSAAIGNPHTCLSCIAQHGRIFPVDEELNDHHNGRCAAVPITPKWESIGLIKDGEANPENRWETGPEWFERQPRDAQRQMMGPELFEAWESGAFEFTPDVISTTYDDDLFGTMRRRRPNYEILGKKGKQAKPPLSDPPAKKHPSTGVGWDEKADGRRRYFKGEPAWLMERAEDYKDELTQRERAAVRRYTGPSYGSINRYMRGVDKDIEADLASTIEHLSEALKKGKSYREGPVYRGIRYHLDNPQGVRTSDDAFDLWNNAKGSSIKWQGFTSTSINPGVASGFSGEPGVIFEIRSTRGRYVRPLSSFDEEYEVLLDRDSKFRVVDVIRQVEVQSRRDTPDEFRKRVLVILDDITDE